MYEIEIEAERRVIYFVFGLDIFVTSDYDKSRENISFDAWQLCISLEWNITQSSVESVIKSKVACTFTNSLQL